MEEINKIVGKNLLTLRKSLKLTQMELAEVFNYSDKSISKWETGESLPSIDVLYELAKFYNVTLNDLVTENAFDQSAPKKQAKQKMFPTHLVITLLSVCAVWLCATILFVTLLLATNHPYSIIFLWALPASTIVLLVFNAVWGKFRFMFGILSAMLWTLLASVHVQVLLCGTNIWPLYFVGIPLQVGIILWGALVKKPRVKKEKAETQTENTTQE